MTGLANAWEFIKQRRELFGSISAKLIAALIVIFPVYEPASANHCFAILIFVILLLCSGAFPPFVTALFIPVLVIGGGVMRTFDTKMPAPAAAKRIVNVMFGTMVPVLLASFVIALCYQKYNVLDRILGIKKGTRALKDLKSAILALMLLVILTCFILPNISAALLVYALASGEIHSQNDERVKKALLISIALAGNIGGFITPISSPQSIFSFTLPNLSIHITWRQWLWISIPCAVLCTIISWLVVCFVYNLWTLSLNERSSSSPTFDTLEDPEYQMQAHNKTTLENDDATHYISNWKLAALLVITLGTVITWAITPLVANYVGDMAIVALLSISLVFSFRLLQPQDLSLIPWDIILLKMGLLALVEAARSSGLLMAMTDGVLEQTSGLSSWPRAALIGLFIFLLSTATGHTIAALVFAPILSTLISTHTSLLDTSSGTLLYVTSMLIASIGMAFPFSGIVNLAMYGIKENTNKDAKSILTGWDFIKCGTLTSIASFIVIITIPHLILS